MTAGPKPKRKLRNFLLDPRFQLKYAVIIALVGGVIFGVMAWLFFDKTRENTQLAVLDEVAARAPAAKKAAPPGPKFTVETESLAPAAEAPADEPPPADAFEKELARRLEAEDTSTLWTLVGFCLLLVALLFVVGILATHRIVGPIYVVDLYVQKIMRGEPVRPRPLRRGDEFQALFQRVNDMAGTLREQRAEDVRRVDEALHLLQARLETLGEGQVSAAQMKVWLEDDLTPIRDMAEEKRAYVEKAS